MRRLGTATIICTASSSTRSRNTGNATICYHIVENEGKTYAKMVKTKIANNIYSM